MYFVRVCLCVHLLFFVCFVFRLNCGKCSNLCLSRLHTWLLVCYVYEEVYVVCVLLVSVRVCMGPRAQVHISLQSNGSNVTLVHTLPTRNISHINVRTTTSRTNPITKTWRNKETNQKTANSNAHTRELTRTRTLDTYVTCMNPRRPSAVMWAKRVKYMNWLGIDHVVM